MHGSGLFESSEPLPKPPVRETRTGATADSTKNRRHAEGDLTDTAADLFSAVLLCSGACPTHHPKYGSELSKSSELLPKPPVRETRTGDRGDRHFVMNRRAVIKDLIIVAGAFVLAPSCVQPTGRASIVLQHFTISDMEEQLLQAVASAIIPPTDTPGAGELGCHLFALKMLDDCYEKNDQDAFIRGLNNFEAYAKTAFNHSFLNCTQKQQQQILSDIEEKRASNADMASFYQTMKEKTIQGYLTSQYVLTNINKYEFIPAEHYNGYAPVNS